MSLVLEFLPEAAAEVDCVTGDYEARLSDWEFGLLIVVGHASRHPGYWKNRMP